MKPLQSEEQTVVFNEIQASEFLNLSRSTLRKARMNGARDKSPAPKYIKLGRSVRYRKSDLEDFLNAHVVTPSQRSKQEARKVIK